jgi:hypothetical protein
VPRVNSSGTASGDVAWSTALGTRIAQFRRGWELSERGLRAEQQPPAGFEALGWLAHTHSLVASDELGPPGQSLAAGDASSGSAEVAPYLPFGTISAAADEFPTPSRLARCGAGRDEMSGPGQARCC